MASSWGDGKGLSDFIRLSEMLAPDEAIILVGVQDELTKTLPKNIIPVRRTSSQKELVLLYQISNIVVSLSHAEAMGLTPIEGMACGKPAIVYDNTALPELVDNNTGIVVKTGDIGGVRKAIDIIRYNGNDYYTKACHERAIKYYNKDKRFEDYIKLYEELTTK